MIGAPARPSSGVRRAFAALRGPLSTLRAMPAPSVRVTLLVGILLRYAIAPYTSWGPDDFVWFHSAATSAHHVGLYDRPGFSYPPVFGYLLAGVGQVLTWLHVPISSWGATDLRLVPAVTASGDMSTFVTSPALNLAVKSLLFAFDAATGWVLYLMVAHLAGSRARARAAFALWFLNPAVIFASSVHAAFDVVVGFTIALTILLMLQRRYLWAGAAWALGVFTKLSPILLVLVLVVALVSAIGVRSPRQLVSATLKAAGGVVLATVVVWAPIIATGSTRLALDSTLARYQVSPAVGGVNLFGIRYLGVFSGIVSWTTDHNALIGGLTSLAELAVAAGVAVWVWRAARRDQAYALVAGVALTLVGILLVTPLTQPQYTLWVLPELVVLGVVWRRGRLALGLASVAYPLFAISLLGPLALATPLAGYTGVVSMDQIASSVVGWVNIPGSLWGATRREDFLSVIAIALCASFVLLFRSLRVGARAPALSTPRVAA